MAIETVSDNELKAEQQWVVRGSWILSDGGRSEWIPLHFKSKRKALTFVKLELARLIDDDTVVSAEYRGPDARPQVVITWADNGQLRLTAEEA